MRPAWWTLRHVAAAKVIEGSTTFAARAEVLRAITAGEHLTTLPFSEQGSRLQFWAPISKFEKQRSRATSISSASSGTPAPDG